MSKVINLADRRSQPKVQVNPDLNRIDRIRTSLEKIDALMKDLKRISLNQEQP